MNNNFSVPNLGTRSSYKNSVHSIRGLQLQRIAVCFLYILEVDQKVLHSNGFEDLFGQDHQCERRNQIHGLQNFQALQYVSKNIVTGIRRYYYINI